MLSEDLIKILISIAAGGLVGLEREFRESSAGFRTLIFICVGSTLFTIYYGKTSPSLSPYNNLTLVEP